jgi:hypothetical protein
MSPQHKYTETQPTKAGEHAYPPASLAQSETAMRSHIIQPFLLAM